jgi:hypothetical protein
MVAEPVERMNYFQFQQVGAEDFRIQQAYHRDLRRRHNLGPHSWGVVTGCRIVETQREGDPGFVDIQVDPGVAVDGFGREIVLLEPARVEPESFGAFDTERVLELWLHYDEYTSRTGSDRLALCAGDGAYSRVIESYRLLVGTFNPSRDPLVVGGDEAKPPLAGGGSDGGAPIEPADSSIPYQDFPDSERNAFWPVRLGSVRWDGTVGKFRPAASASVLVQGRRYAGFIGASLLAEGQALRLAPREPVELADRDDSDFLGVEGRMTVDGRIVARKDLFLHGGMASFQSDGGSDETVPLWIRRLAPPSGSGADLRIHIGDNSASGSARLTIGAGAAPNGWAEEKVVLAVRADDKVDLPSGRLRFSGAGRQAIDLSVPDDAQPSTSGIGWQAGSVYQRAADSHYWFRGGEHAAGPGDPGSGKTLMQLSSAGSLHFGELHRQVFNINVGSQAFGIGVQDNTLYMRSPVNFAWYRGGGHDPAALSAGGGAHAMSLDSTSRLTVDGGVRSKGSVEIWGSALDFRDTGGGTDTDPLEIARVHRGADQNDLQVTIGDNNTGGDRFVVGPRLGGVMSEKFVVQNDGNIHVGGNLFVKGKNVLIDVIAGEVALNQVGAGSGIHNLVVSSSRLSQVSEAQVMVALSHIHNVNTASDAGWRVAYVPGTRTLQQPNQATFPIHWAVSDSDGQLLSFSYIAILLA